MLYSTILYMFSEQSFLILLEEMESSERREEGVAAEYSDVLSQQTNVWGAGVACMQIAWTFASNV